MNEMGSLADGDLTPRRRSPKTLRRHRGFGDLTVGELRIWCPCEQDADEVPTSPQAQAWCRSGCSRPPAVRAKSCAKAGISGTHDAVDRRGVEKCRAIGRSRAPVAGDRGARLASVQNSIKSMIRSATNTKTKAHQAW